MRAAESSFILAILFTHPYLLVYVFADPSVQSISTPLPSSHDVYQETAGRETPGGTAEIWKGYLP
jgi:hypothetical protein